VYIKRLVNVKGEYRTSIATAEQKQLLDEENFADDGLPDNIITDGEILQ